MYNRCFSVAVTLLWLSTMSWLLIEKVLPPLMVGDPPNYRTILDAQRNELPVGWGLYFDGDKIGWALSTTKKLPNDLTEINSRVHFDKFPLREITPGWLRAFLHVTEGTMERLKLNARSTLIIDPLGRLSRFEASVRINPLENLISLRGTVEDGRLDLSVRSSDFLYSTEAYLPTDGLLGDAISPQTQLPGLRVGQQWRVPAYSLFRPPNSPLEMLHATVDRTEAINYNNRIEVAYLVVYRPDSGVELGKNRPERGRLWVRRDGTVLRQEVMLFGSPMTFVRLSGQDALALEALNDDT